MEWYSILFYALFVAQMFLISYYFPRKIVGRVRKVLEKHPPSEYPKLYPKSVEYYRIGHRAFELLNRGLLVVGFLILIALLTVVDHSTFADDGFISEFWPALYGMLQLIPFVVLEFAGFSQFKLMRANNSATVRKAPLRPRRFLELVPQRLLVVAIALFVGSIAIDFYLHDFIVDWRHDSSQRALVLVGANLFMVGIGLWQIYGRKLDPYQSHSDRDRQTRAQWTSLLACSGVMSLFMLSTAVDDVIDIDYLDASLMSVYFMVIVVVSIGHLIRSLRLEDIDFEVYRADTAAG